MLWVPPGTTEQLFPPRTDSMHFQRARGPRALMYYNEQQKKFAKVVPIIPTRPASYASKIQHPTAPPLKFHYRMYTSSLSHTLIS